jgi:hypothetical protein
MILGISYIFFHSCPTNEDKLYVISGWMGNQLYVTPPNGHLPAIENGH